LRKRKEPEIESSSLPLDHSSDGSQPQKKKPRNRKPLNRTRIYSQASGGGARLRGLDEVDVDSEDSEMELNSTLLLSEGVHPSRICLFTDIPHDIFSVDPSIDSKSLP